MLGGAICGAQRADPRPRRSLYEAYRWRDEIRSLAWNNLKALETIDLKGWRAQADAPEDAD